MVLGNKMFWGEFGWSRLIFVSTGCVFDYRLSTVKKGKVTFCQMNRVKFISVLRLIDCCESPLIPFTSRANGSRVKFVCFKF